MTDAAGGDDAGTWTGTAAPGGTAAPRDTAAPDDATLFDADGRLTGTAAAPAGGPARTDAAAGNDRTWTDAATGADLGFTRSEERLRVGTESIAIARVRVEKYIVTEERTISVTVRREEVRLVREPISDGPPTTPDVSSDLDLILSEEQVVVTKQIVPIERVRLTRSTVTEDQVVEATLGAERIDVSTS